MRLHLSVRDLAAAFLVALLPIVVFAGAVQAQTISNIAEARWRAEGEWFAAQSNRVDVERARSDALIETYLLTAPGAIDLSYRTPRCLGTSGTAGMTPEETDALTASIAPSAVARVGHDLIFTVSSSLANRDPGRVETLIAEISGDAGDAEEMEIFETGADSGVFVGRIATMRIPPAPVPGDCRLGISDGRPIDIAVHLPGNPGIVAALAVDVLADPYGMLFDSGTGEAVSGARVTLVAADTGQPATVFAPDGVTGWPSTVISGQPVRDANGRDYALAPGEYWFPFTALGRYRIVVEPPAPFTAPSVVAPAQLAGLERPDGAEFAITEASYGEPFMLGDATPLRIDIPLDRPSAGVTLDKQASRAIAQPGDAIFYTLTVRNPDPARIKRAVVVTDIPSPWLRLRPDSIRIDGVAVPEAADIAADGGSIALALGDIAGGGAVRVTYAMVVRADAPPGQAVNRAEASDALGQTALASAGVRIERDNIAGRMTLIGRVIASGCAMEDERVGIPGVRVMLEDGSFAVTDRDGRYHFEGLVPGTHVVQAAGGTLPEGGLFVDCTRSTRSAGSASSRFVVGQGGSLAVADFHAVLPEGALPVPVEDLDDTPVAGLALAPAGQGPETDWIALGDGPDGWLTPAVDANPRAPAIRVVIRHRKGQSVRLRANGEPVDPLSFDGTVAAPEGDYAVSLWRGVPLAQNDTMLAADIVNSAGGVNATIERTVHFTTTPARVELVPQLSHLVADGRTRPVVAIRVRDRNDRPLREGIAGEFTLSAPYHSAAQLERQQLDQLTGIGQASSARWMIEGDDGIALIELAPTMVSGSLQLDFRFDDGEIVREQVLETWIEPGDIEWTIVGLAEGSVGARTVADNMERSGRFDSDLGEEARVALYAKGCVLGKFLLTLAYDSAKQRDDQRVLGAIDPQAYYTVFGDATTRRFDAASREKLYVRVETATFYALYGDFETGFDQTRLARYNRVATGVKAEARLGAVSARGFAADIGTRFRRDEIQGQGITGPYRLSSRALVANSEQVAIEVRDRFRSELVVERRELTRFLDYDIDLLSGTITFKKPVLSRDFDLNPQFIVIDYETDALGAGRFNAGLRADWTDPSGAIRIGATAITDRGDEARTDIGAIDLRGRIGTATEIRAELAVSRSNGAHATGWLVEAQHQTGSLDLLAYARSLDPDYGVGQQNGAELGRRKLGVDARYRFDESTALLASLWQDDSLTDAGRRRAAQLHATRTTGNTDLRLGISHFTDRLADGSTNVSTVLEGGVTQRLFDNRLELGGTSSIALDGADSVDLPARHRISARYAITQGVRLVGLYEIAEGDEVSARTISGGVEVTPWTGGRLVSSLGKQRIDEFGNRSYGAFGLAQSLALSSALTVDATVDGSRTLGGNPDPSAILNPQHPVTSGGHLGQDGALFEDFTAATLGAAWRQGRWSATVRGEYRDGEFADRKGLTFGAIRQLGEGSIVGSGLTWTEAEGGNGATSAILDAALAVAHRPEDSDFALLGKLEYRSDAVTGAVAGETGPAGRTALTVSGDAQSRRLLASVSANWSPSGRDERGDRVQRSELGLFLGARYNFDRFEGYALSGSTVLVGADARIGVGERFEIGATATLRTSLNDGGTSFAVGPALGFVPAEGMLLTVGYNLSGFRDPDFAAARNTDQGLFAAVRFKFDTETFAFLGLRR